MAFHEEKRETRGNIIKRLGEITPGKVKKTKLVEQSRKPPKSVRKIELEIKLTRID